MKKIVIALLILGAFALGQNQQRMVFQGSERIQDGNGSILFDYFHDTQTKQEVVCAFGRMNVTACYLTGRTW